MYSQITLDERYTLGILRQLGYRPAEIARALGRHRSTISREVRRNSRSDGAYRPLFAHGRSGARRSRSRRHPRFTAADFRLVQRYLKRQWSPEQIAGYLRRIQQLRISHETIYRHIWDDKSAGGSLHTHLRGAPKKRRKRYGRYDSRGRLAGKRPITDRPPVVAARTEGGHWEIDTVLRATDRHCVLSLVEHCTGYLVLGKLPARTANAVTRRSIQLIHGERHPVRTITADNGTEFHRYDSIERATGSTVYFATPHHAWERGTNENTNGLLRQYLPKGRAWLTSHNAPATLSPVASTHDPRKRLGSLTPEECYATLF